MRTTTSAITAMIITAGTVGLGASVAYAAPGAITGASFNWKVNECAFAGAFVTAANEASDSCFSIREDQTTSGNVAKTDGGWVFSDGTGTYDPSTGATELDFTGSLRFGNINRGNYYVELADPTVSVDSDGTGALSATVLVKGPGPGTVEDRGTVDVVDLVDVPDATQWSVTPPWAGVGTPDESAPLEGKQFASEFVDTIDSSMRNWFRASSSAEATEDRGEYNSYKSPAPLSVSFAETVWTPALSVTGAANLAPNETRTVTVRGSGFDPTKQGNGVAGLYVVFGPNPADLANGYNDPGVFGAAQYLPSGPDVNGEFETTLEITGNYTDGNDVAWSPATTPMGVSVWAAHTRLTTAWDSFSPIAFTDPGDDKVTDPAPVSKPTKARNVRVAKIKKKKVVVKWKKSKNGTATGYQVRISKPGKPKKFKSWKSSSNTKTTLSGTNRSGKYRVQVKAVNDTGSAKKVTIRFTKR